MAVLFTILLSCSTAILGYFIYSYTNGEPLADGKVAISAETYNIISWLGGICIFFMSLVVVISYLLSIFVVNRINTIGITAQKIIDTGDLSQRISIDNKWDDLSNLADILNYMFTRIEQLLADVREVSDNIAHDLRTPLTRLRSNLESVKENPADHETIEKLIGEADSLLKTFNAMLRITNIEKGQRYGEMIYLRLDKILQDVVELYEPIAEEKQIKLTTEFEDTNFTGDKDLLFQAFANLLDNAIKFTPQNGNIFIQLKTEPGGPVIILSDSGKGIPDEEKDKVFIRFYRGDESRNSPGNGLGLSFVNAVINLHKASIELADNKPSGLTVTIKF